MKTRRERKEDSETVRSLFVRSSFKSNITIYYFFSFIYFSTPPTINYKLIVINYSFTFVIVPQISPHISINHARQKPKQHDHHRNSWSFYHFSSSRPNRGASAKTARRVQLSCLACWRSWKLVEFTIFIFRVYGGRF